ncbi:hypothetical protein [Mycoplasmopsis bovis]|uniref:hypothetical protein n=1 Tax=Mycoplasmopsis bovis TaxID=28903 RepID=UPI001CF3B120|nr:hypothetical protein [Mycoplasmopsis bovis]UCP05849.1 hypothetical protein JNG56_04290 [Mycoplasmopsis bovis]
MKINYTFLKFSGSRIQCLFFNSDLVCASCCELVPAPDPGLVPASCCELVPAPCCELVPVPGPGLVANSYFPVIKFESSMALTVNLLSLNSTVEKWSNVNFSNPFTF